MCLRLENSQLCNHWRKETLKGRRKSRVFYFLWCYKAQRKETSRKKIPTLMANPGDHSQLSSDLTKKETLKINQTNYPRLPWVIRKALGFGKHWTIHTKRLFGICFLPWRGIIRESILSLFPRHWGTRRKSTYQIAKSIASGAKPTQTFMKHIQNKY